MSPYHYQIIAHGERNDTRVTIDGILNETIINTSTDINFEKGSDADIIAKEELIKFLSETSFITFTYSGFELHIIIVVLINYFLVNYSKVYQNRIYTYFQGLITNLKLDPKHPYNICDILNEIIFKYFRDMAEQNATIESYELINSNINLILKISDKDTSNINIIFVYKAYLIYNEYKIHNFGNDHIFISYYKFYLCVKIKWSFFITILSSVKLRQDDYIRIIALLKNELTSDATQCSDIIAEIVKITHSTDKIAILKLIYRIILLQYLPELLRILESKTLEEYSIDFITEQIINIISENKSASDDELYQNLFDIIHKSINNIFDIYDIEHNNYYKNKYIYDIISNSNISNIYELIFKILGLNIKIYYYKDDTHCNLPPNYSFYFVDDHINIFPGIACLPIATEVLMLSSETLKTLELDSYEIDIFKYFYYYLLAGKAQGEDPCVLCFNQYKETITFSQLIRILLTTERFKNNGNIFFLYTCSYIIVPSEYPKQMSRSMSDKKYLKYKYKYKYLKYKIDKNSV